MKAYLYILKCKNGCFYTGSTNNIELRLSQHKAGEGSNYTRNNLPVELVYCQEFSSIEEAFAREKQVQGWSHKKKLALIEGNYRILPELSKKRS